MQAPLSGVRILDLSAVVSGPMAAGILADQGADVIKVETQGGDLTRRVGPIQGDMTSLFATINRGKRAIVLDLKQAAAQDILRQLIEKTDVLVENFRPGAMARLGFGYEQVKAWNPRIVYVSITGFGQTGPYSGYRVYDPVIQAVSGFADAHPDFDTQEPRLLQTLMCDKITALTAAQVEALAGEVAVDHGDDDVAMVWLDGPVHQHHRTIQNAGVPHGVAPNANEEGGLGVTHQLAHQFNALHLMVFCR